MNIIDKYSPVNIECYFDQKINNDKLLNVNKYKLIYKLWGKTISTTKFNMYDKNYFIAFATIKTNITNWIDGIYECQLKH